MPDQWDKLLAAMQQDAADPWNAALATMQADAPPAGVMDAAKRFIDIQWKASPWEMMRPSEEMREVLRGVATETGRNFAPFLEAIQAETSYRNLYGKGGKAKATQRIARGVENWIVYLTSIAPGGGPLRDLYRDAVAAMHSAIEAKGDNRITEGALSALEQAPLILPSMGMDPITSGAYWYSQLAPRRYDQFRAEMGPGNEGRARAAAALTAAPEAAVEVALGKLIGVGGGQWLKTLGRGANVGKQGLARAVGRVLANVIWQWTKEVAEEPVQETSSETFKRLFAIGMEGELKGPPFVQRIKDSITESMVPIAFMMLTGGGASMASQRIALLAETPSRKEMADALGMSVQDMRRQRPELYTAEGRRAEVARAREDVQRAESIGAQAEAAGPAEGVLEGADRSLRVRDAAQDRLAAQPGEGEAEGVSPPVAERPGVAEIRAYEQQRAEAEAQEVLEVSQQLAATQALKAYEAARDDIMEMIGEPRRPSPRPQRLLGIEARKRTMGENVLLRRLLGREARGARLGWRAGQLELTANHQELLDFAKDNLPDDAYKLVVRAAEKAVKARTPAQRKAVIKAVNRMVEQAQRVGLEAEFRGLRKRMRRMKLRPEFQQATDALLQDIAQAKHRPATLERMQGVLEAAERDNAGQIPEALIERAQRILADVGKREIAKLTNEELRDVIVALGKIAVENQRKNRMLVAGRVRTLEQAQQDGVDRIHQLHGVNVQGKRVLKYAGQERQPHKWFGLVLFRAQRSVESIARRIFGKGDGTYNFLVPEYRHNRQHEAQLRTEVDERVAQLLAETGLDAKGIARASNYFGRRWLAKVLGADTEPIILTLKSGRKWKTTLGELGSFLNTAERKRQRHHLLRHKQKGAIQENDLRSINLTPAEIFEIEQSPQANRARRLRTGLRNIIVKYLQPQVGEVYLENTGTPMPMEDDYWPTHRYQGEKPKDRFATRALNREGDLQDMSYFQPLKGGNEAFVIRDMFAEFFDYAQRATQYIALSQWLNNTRALLGREGSPLALAIQEGLPHGPDYYKYINDRIDDVEALQPTRSGTLAHGFNILARNWHRGKLGGKVHIVASQTVSYAAFLNAGISAKHLREGTKGDDKQTRSEMRKWNAHLYRRITGTGGYAVVSAAEQAPAMAQMYGLNQTVLDKIGIGGIHWADAKTVMAGWRAVKAEARDRGLTGEAQMRYVSERADEAVDETQPTWDAMTTPQLIAEVRGKPIRMLVPGVRFSSQRGKNINMVTNAVDDYAQLPADQKTAQAKAKMVARIANATLVQAVLLQGIRKGVKWALYAAISGLLVSLGFKRRKDERRWSYLRESFEALERVLGNWIVVGDVLRRLTSIAYTRITDAVAQAEYRRQQDSAVDVLREGHEAGLAVSEAVEQIVTQERYAAKPWTKRWPYTTGRAWLKLNESLSSIFGIPLSGANTILRPILDIVAPPHITAQKARKKRMEAIP